MLWLPILVKAVSTGLVVVLAAVVAEAVGPFWGALVACLPVSGGPAYVFLAMQHDAGFVAASALSSLAANAATAVFLVVYALEAERLPLRWGLGAALAAWCVVCVLVHQVAWTPGRAVALNMIAYGAGFWLVRGVPRVAIAPRSTAVRRWFDLPLRAGMVAVFVTGVVVGSAALGPAVTGIAAVFPISLSSLLVMVRPRIGGAASALLAVSALRAMLGFGLGLLVLHLAIPPFGVAAALGGGLLATVVWSGLLLVLKIRLRTR